MFITVSIFSSIVAAITLFFIIKLYKEKKNLQEELEKLSEYKLKAEEIKLLEKIYSITYNKSSLSESCDKLQEIILNHFSINYCSIFSATSRQRLQLISSNVKSAYFPYLDLCSNDFLKSLNKNSGGKIQRSDHPLNYPSAMERKVRYMYFIPLFSGDKLIGSIMLENENVDEMEKIETEFFKIVVKNISVILKNLIADDFLLKSNFTDGLTNIKNKKALDKEIVEKIQLYSKTDNTFAMAVLDIDKFKSFNDTYGHLVGDIVLKEVSGFIKDKIRPEDELYRYGGEEFVIFFDNTTSQEIFSRLDTIRDEMSRHCIEHEGKDLSVTASFGLVSYPTNGSKIKELIDKADMAMYNSKQTGRNKVTIYDPSLSHNPENNESEEIESGYMLLDKL